MSIVFNLIIIAMVGFIAYMWSQEGLFSALIHFLCTVIAGAVALAVWEPLAYIMLGVREDIAWSVSLAIPFLITLALLRVAMDKAIPNNIKFSSVVNLIGGGAFGVGSGAIAVGILVISMGFLRLPSGFLGYKPITYDAQGNLTRSAGLWIPVDRVTAELYERLSVSGFATGTPLAMLAPNIHEQAALMRITFDDRGRTTLSPEDIVVIGRYTVTAANPTELFKDEQSDRSQQVRDLSGDSFLAGTTLEGFTLKFESGAKESGGQIVWGSGQIALLYEDEQGVTQRVLPAAMVTQAMSDAKAYGRFRYDADEVFLASVGAASTSTMAFEFPVPPRCTPTYLMVRNVRVPVSAFSALPVDGAEGGVLSVAARDAAIDVEQLLPGSVAGVASSGSGGGTDEITRGGITINGIDRNDLNNSGISIGTSLATGFSRSNKGSLKINDDNEIVSGKQLFNSMDGSAPPKLLVRRFATSHDTTLIQVDVSFTSRVSIHEKATTPILNNASVQLRMPGESPFDVVGYIHKDAQGKVEISYDPGRPIRSLGQLPKVSQSKPDDQVILLFLVTKNARIEIETLQLGPIPIATFEPPLKSVLR